MAHPGEDGLGDGLRPHDRVHQGQGTGAHGGDVARLIRDFLGRVVPVSKAAR